MAVLAGEWQEPAALKRDKACRQAFKVTNINLVP